MLVFNWCYHGSVDEAFVTLGAGGGVRSRAGNVGPPVDPAETTRVAEFNDLESVEAALAHGDVACVLMEPALTNIGIVLPEDGFLAAVREACTRTGTLLIIDETHTLSAGPGGCTAAWGLEPDAVTLGKSIGGGVPIGAYGVTAELAERIAAAEDADLEDTGGVGGTLAGNALSLAAARATLGEVLTDEAFARMSALRERFVAGVEEALERHSVPWTIVSLGARAEYRFCAEPPRTGAESAAAADRHARGVSAPVPAQPRRADHPVPQHGPDVPGDDRGGGRPPHRGIRRGREGALRMTEHHRLHPDEGAQVGDKGLKKDAIGFLDGLVIGISSTAPAYSLAAVIAIVVVGVGVQAPAVMLVSFVPMFLIASAFYYMNRADPDCGTSFSWITRAMGPSLGWVGGWAVVTTGIIVIGSLAEVAAYYTFDLFGPGRSARLQGGERIFTLHHHRGDDDDLRDRHRAVGAHPARHDLRPGRRAAAVRGGRADQGRGAHVRAVLALAVRDRQHQRADPRRAHRGVHLLGLGERGQPQRGDVGLGQLPRAWRRSPRP